MTVKHWTGRTSLGALMLVLVASSAWAQDSAMSSSAATGVLRVSSGSFADGQSMPQKLTCDGPDVSPDIQWSSAPAGTQSYVIVMDDPDAPPGFTHWLAYDIPAATHDLPEGASTPATRLGNADEGINNFDHAGYGGPCPPEGRAHHYVFRVYALDVNPGLPAGQSKEQVMAAMHGHVLAQGQLTGLYARAGG
jgi:Raf kinase inhibitor-like YbhB/YbcL family protein